MDFLLSEEQQAAAELAAELFSDHCTSQRLAAVQGWFDADLWAALAQAGLLGLVLPDAYGGAGLGLIELHLLLEQAGRAAAPVPLYETLALGALPIAAFGTPELQSQVLPGVVAGDVRATAALSNPAGDVQINAEADAGGWVLNGTASFVPSAGIADVIVVEAALGDERQLFVVRTESRGFSCVGLPMSGGIAMFDLLLSDVRVTADEALTTDGAASWLRSRAIAGLASLQAGVCGQALRMTADYATERHQFARPIGSFQAVGHRVADAYIDAEGIRLTALQVAWRLDQELPADDELLIAKWWASEGAHRLIHAAQHVHGGVGVDRDYPLHHYFTLAKQIEFAMGSASEQLVALGRAMASQVPVGI